MNPAKSILSSRTFWLNSLGALAAASTLANGTIPAKYAPAVVAVGGISNIILRFLTSQPIA